MSSREDRIMNLAATLKASGLAKSEVQAKMMAEEMIGVEENVQKKYDEEHAKAQEYLKTAKNLGNPRVMAQASDETQKTDQSRAGTVGRRIEPISQKNDDKNTILKAAPDQENYPASSAPARETPEPEAAPQPAPAPKRAEKSIDLEEVHTDVNLGKGTLRDLMLNQIKSENHEIKTIEQLEKEAEQQKDGAPEISAQDDASTGRSEELEGSQGDGQFAPPPELEEDASEDFNDPAGQPEYEPSPPSDAQMNNFRGESEDSSDDASDDVSEQEPEETGQSSGGKKTGEKDGSALDGKKLQEMMEEDGPMEEHTREIPSKPENVRPKEDYVENTVNLSDMFNVNKK